METVRMIMTRKFLLQLFAWLIISVALLGVCADCSSERGQWQGGNDSGLSDRWS